jgi:biopolymer transport protein TolR
MSTGIRNQLFLSSQRTEANLTSLMDLTFILLITFMVAFPMVEQATPVKLPSGTGNPLRPDESMAITLDGEGRLFLGTDSLTLEEFEARAAALKATQPDIVLLVRGDKAAVWGRMSDVFQVLQKVGLTRVALVTQVGQPATPARP